MRREKEREEEKGLATMQHLYYALRSDAELVVFCLRYATADGITGAADTRRARQSVRTTTPPPSTTLKYLNVSKYYKLAHLLNIKLHVGKPSDLIGKSSCDSCSSSSSPPASYHFLAVKPLWKPASWQGKETLP